MTDKKFTLGSPRAAESETNASELREIWNTKNSDERTQQLLSRDSNSFLHQSVSTPCLSAIAKAEGIWIEDLQGRKYMDFHGNSVHHIGYGHPRLKEAIKRQIDTLSFAPRRYTCETAVELAEKLTDITPPPLQKVLFTTGGSDAIEVAMKIARAATGRFKTISFWDAFHGAGFGASSIGGEELFRSHIAGPLLPGTEHVAPFNCYRCPYGYKDVDGQPDFDICHLTCANFVRYVLEKEGDVAAVIAEPMRAVPYIPPPGFWRSVKEACNAHGALLIFDEIPTGLGKTGRMFSCEHEDVVPDILVLGKSLGGGMLPLAAVVCRPELDQCKDFAIGHYTHEKNPVTCRAGLTTIQIIEQEGLVENARELGEFALNRLNELKEKFDVIGDVRGRGLLMGIELVNNRESKQADNALAERVFYHALENGLSFKISMGNVLTLSPPLTISKNELSNALDILQLAFETVTHNPV